MAGLIERLRVWLHWRRTQADLAEEMEAHRALKRAELERAGIAPARSAAAAQREMGNETWMREEARRVWLWPWLEALGQGLRQGARRLRRTPGFTAAAVLTLGLGIGANTAIFSVVEAVMLRPLPYPQADRIVAYSLRLRAGDEPAMSIPEFAYLRDQARAVTSVAGYRGLGTVELDHGGGTTWADGLEATDGFFAVLGVRPRMGRGFTRADTLPGAAVAVVLGDGLWHRAFGGDPGVVGRMVRVDGRSGTVVGIMPPGFRFQEQPADLYQALQFDGDLGNRGLNTEVIGRLRAGATLAQAQAETAGLAQGLRSRGSLPSSANSLDAADYQATETSTVRSSLWFLLGAVGLLLLIACANVAGLTLARTLARQPEIALRRALGAGRGRLLLQFLAEGLVLAGCGAAVGLVLAEAALRGLAAKLPWDVPLAGPIQLDGRVLGFTLTVALGASLVFGVASAWQTRERRLAPARFQRRGWGRDAMVTGEVALTLLLLAGAGLLVRSLVALEQQPLGFQPSGRTVFATELPAEAARSSADAWRFDQAVLRNLRALPGVRAAAAINVLPLEGQSNLPGEPAAQPGLGTAVEYRAVSPDYFAAMGIPMLAGRDVDAGDRTGAPLVAVVSESLAKHWFAGQSPIGGQVRMGVIGDQVYVPEIAAPRAIVGVVGDVKVQSLDRPARLTVYVPAAQTAPRHTQWVAHGESVNEAQIRQAVKAANAGARVSVVATMDAVVANTLAPQTFEARLTGLFALLALALTAVGLYGLLAYAVTERTREIGIRMALGARPGTILGQVVGRGMALALGGIVVGWAASLPLAHLIASLLYGVRPNDAATLAAVSALLALVALGACYLPARRATRVDPALALRAE